MDSKYVPHYFLFFIIFYCIYSQIYHLNYYLFHFENFRIFKALFNRSLNEYLQYERNTLQGTYFLYSVTIHIDSNQITSNSTRQTEYCSYLVLKYQAKPLVAKPFICEPLTLLTVQWQSK